MMKSALDGRVAMVTGAARGIGLATARALAEAGAEVAMLDCDARELRRAAKGVGCPGLVADVSKKASVELAVGRVLKRLRRIDILINNAGIWRWTPILEVNGKTWDRVQAVNVKGILFCSQAVARTMVRQGGGKIVNIASLATFSWGGGWGAYCASKAAAVNLTQTLADELGRHNVQVNAICPGATDTRMCRQITQETPGGDSFPNVRNPEDVAAVVLDLVCPFEQKRTGQIVRMG